MYLLQQEYWRVLPNSNNTEISSNGRVKRNGIVSVYNQKAGYITITLKNKTISVHRLVAFYFVFNPFKLNIVNHKNGNTKDNAAVNLEWATVQQNVIHGYSLKFKKVTCLSKEQIKEIYILSKIKRNKDLAEMFNTKQEYISYIKNKKKHFSKYL